MSLFLNFIWFIYVLINRNRKYSFISFRADSFSSNQKISEKKTNRQKNTY